MFDPYAESLSSTGEPPTIPPESSRNNLYSTQTLCAGDHAETSHEEMSTSLSSGNRSRTLSVQEPDSGYEASPSSIADNQRFFGEQPMAVANQIDLLQPCILNPDEEFDFVECHSQTLFSESESDLEDYDTCQDCCSSFLTCSCSRTDSSSTNATAISNCDNSRCNSSDLSFNRPSSQPIQVPNQQSCRISPELRSRLEHSLNTLLDMYPGARSLPISFSHLQTLGLIPENHPLSWPSVPHSALNIRRRAVALPSPRNHHISLNRDISNRRLNHPRSRRQIIDSEASSFCSSDDEGPEDVFNMTVGEPSSFPMTSPRSVPLPDIVLESTESERRGRSASVSLPLDARRLEVIRDVGQRLRAMSDLFVQRREFCRAMMRLGSRRASDSFDPHPNGES